MSQQCKTQSDCFEELARVMRMIGGTQVQLYLCIKNLYHGVRISAIPSFDYPSHWSFAIAIVEDKPVFVGDTLWLDGDTLTITNASADTAGTWYLETNEGMCLYPSRVRRCSWKPLAPPKPVLQEGFIPHDGGECPVDGDTIVKVSYVGYGNPFDIEDKAKYASWNEVIGYKVIKPTTVMVELRHEVAQYYALRERSGTHNIADEHDEACRKALEERNMQ